MTKLYEKSELNLALACIMIYCVLQSLANPLNEMIGIEYSASAVFCILQAVILLRFLQKNALLERYGLCRSSLPARRFLCYVPLILIATRNFWNGAAVHYTAAGAVCRIACMLCVGLVEELIFRGLLFLAIARDNVKTAAAISSVTFGLGHLLNLVNGSGMELTETLCQVVLAAAIGLLFVIIFYRGGSLLPCIVTHSAINVTSTFAGEAGLTAERAVILDLMMLVMIAAYTLYLAKTLPRARCPGKRS